MPRTVLVTGGSRGIGLAVAEAFQEKGYRVAVTRRDSAAPDGFFNVACDVTDPRGVDRAFTAVEEEIGPVEILVANAGITEDSLLMRMGDEQFSRVLDTNLYGAWRCARRAVRPMVRARWGRVIFMSSVSAYSGGAGQTNYAASKSGLVGIARSMVRELGPRNITTNVVAPGWIDTEMTAALPSAHRAKVLEEIPLGRPGSVRDVASAVTWLAAEESGYITGAVLPVDGGLGMGH
ncbi:3-oxoacyl-ACP reductase FabG [Streptomyces sp. NBC_00289]|uniref:3-oxoacyl-ACP reductase FabG n=1 Tax=Streptomyces sp. NBC_00289 TaxID=2975703 RepID=UPI00324C4319